MPKRIKPITAPPGRNSSASRLRRHAPALAVRGRRAVADAPGLLTPTVKRRPVELSSRLAGACRSRQDGLGLSARPHQREALNRHRGAPGAAGAAPENGQDPTLSGRRRDHAAMCPALWRLRESRLPLRTGLGRAGVDPALGVARPADRPPRPHHRSRQIPRPHHHPRPRLDRDWPSVSSCPKLVTESGSRLTEAFIGDASGREGPFTAVAHPLSAAARSKRLCCPFGGFSHEDRTR
jgi:hypothetical protein